MNKLKKGRLKLFWSIVLSWLIGCVIVRLGLDWADSYPYSPASERRYFLIMFLSLTTALSLSIYSWRRFRKNN